MQFAKESDFCGMYRLILTRCWRHDSITAIVKPLPSGDEISMSGGTKTGTKNRYHFFFFDLFSWPLSYDCQRCHRLIGDIYIVLKRRNSLENG